MELAKFSVSRVNFEEQIDFIINIQYVKNDILYALLLLIYNNIINTIIISVKY